MQKIQILASLRRLWRPLFSVYKVLDTIKFEQSSVLLRVNELFLLNLYSFLIFYILQSNLNLFKKKNIFPLSSKEAFHKLRLHNFEGFLPLPSYSLRFQIKLI